MNEWKNNKKDFTIPTNYYIHKNIVEKMKQYIDDKFWDIIFNKLAKPTGWDSASVKGNGAPQEIKKINDNLNANKKPSNDGNSLWINLNSGDKKTLPNHLYYFYIDWMKKTDINNNKESIIDNVETIYKYMFKYIRQREILTKKNYYNKLKYSDDIKETYEPLFLAKFNLKDSWGTMKNGISLKSNGTTLEMTTNVIGYEQYIPDDLILAWKKYEKIENTDNSLEKHKQYNNNYMIYKELADEEEKIIINSNNYDVKEWRNSINLLYEKLKDNVLSKNNWDITSKISNINKIDKKWLERHKIEVTSQDEDYYLNLKNYQEDKLENILKKYIENEKNDDVWWKTWEDFRNKTRENNTGKEYYKLQKVGGGKITQWEDMKEETIWVNNNQGQEEDTEPKYIDIYNNNSLNEEKLNNHMSYVDHFKQKKLTYNNDESSRTHIIYELLICQEGHNSHTIGNKLIICDLAGKEDLIDSKKMTEYIRNIYTGKDGNYKSQWDILENMNKLYKSKFKTENQESGRQEEETKYSLYTVENDNITVHLNNEHKYILDLLSEGRMINSTLENLKEIITTKQYNSSEYITDYFNYYKSNTFDNLPKSSIKKMGINISSKISKKYETIDNIQKREYDQLKIPYADGSDWFKVENKLSLAIKNTRNNGHTTNYILLTINLNERSTKEDIEKIIDDNGEELGKFKAESTLASLCFVKQLALLNDNFENPIFCLNDDLKKFRPDHPLKKHKI